MNLVDAQRKLQLPINSLLLGAIGGAPAPAELFKRIKDSLNLDKMSVIEQCIFFFFLVKNIILHL